MYMIKAARWHTVEVLPALERARGRRCTVCAGSDLGPLGELVLDAVSGTHYRIVRCAGCGYDLLESVAPASPVAIGRT